MASLFHFSSLEKWNSILRSEPEIRLGDTDAFIKLYNASSGGRIIDIRETMNFLEYFV